MPRSFWPYCTVRLGTTKPNQCAKIPNASLTIACSSACRSGENALLNSSFGSALPGWSQKRAREASTQKASPRLMRGLVLAIAALSGL